MDADQPHVIILAGPNGAGKSTTAPMLLRDAFAVDEFVNADAIAAGLSAFAPETVALEAGKIMLRRIHELAAKRRNFAFETTLASRSFAPWARKLQETGYTVHLLFLALPSVEFALDRVALRASLGGHSIHQDIIRRRFDAGLRNLFRLYIPLADFWRIYDNSNPGQPLDIVEGGRKAYTPLKMTNRQWYEALITEYSHGE
ncbi:MAG: zeta toxin family protein [Clostridium sp.]|nr:zeta toxin family protein [Clostridium sp.]